jgi:hypothetical protein
MAVAIVMIGCAAAVTGAVGQADRAVRAPAVAGQFYPDDAGKLRAAIEAFMRDARPARVEDPVAIVVPHAGYIFSGQIAADGYRQVAGLAVDTVVILGTNHTSGTFRRISVYEGAGYQTPLGVAAVDRQLADALVNEGGAVFDTTLHEREHSVEVQVPFVQVVFPNAKIVPVVVGSADRAQAIRFARTLAALVKDRRVLVVASSDLSHYPPQREAVAIDRGTLAGIAGFDPAAIDDASAGEAAPRVTGIVTRACGLAPILVSMETARALGATRGTVVSYANSGDTPVGTADRVVGYGAVVYGRGPTGIDDAAARPVAADDRGALDAADKRALIDLARDTITRYLRTGTLPLPRGGSPRLQREAGVFVTVKKHGELRGCVGRILPEGTLIRLVSAMAVESAFKDPRFPPVTARELGDLDIEISVLTTMTPVASPDAIVVGRDGVLLRVGKAGAVFLPQIATEQGWTRVQLLDQLAEKAGLLSSAWRGTQAKLQTFQAIVFSESSLK